MPIRDTTNAPKFDGTIKDLKRYLGVFKQHADAAGLTGQDRIQGVLSYLDPDDAETWETVTEVTGSDYDAFITAVKLFYPGCDDKPEYSRADLEYVVAEYAAKPMHSIEEVAKYDRAFRRISTNLLTNKRIAEIERNHLYLDGFHSDIRARILRRLEIVKPDVRPGHPYEQKDVLAAATFLLPGVSSLQPRQPTVATQAPVASPSAISTPSYPSRIIIPPAPQVVIKKEYTTTARSPFAAMKCYFCGNEGHSTKNCPEADAYIQAGRITRVNGKLCIPDHDGLPKYSNARTFKENVDIYYKEARERRQSSEPVTRDSPPHIIAGIYCCSGPEIEVETESPARLNTTTVLSADLQAKEVERAAYALGYETARKEFAKQKKIVQPEEIASPQVKEVADKTPSSKNVGQPTTGKPNAPSPQFKFAFPGEDPTASTRAVKNLLDSPMSLQVRDVLSMSHDFRKQLRDQTATQRVSTNTMSVNELAGRSPEAIWGPYEESLHRNDEGIIVGHHSVPLRSIKALVGGKRTVTCLLDSGAEIVAMRKDIWQSLGVPLRSDHLMTMESANKTKNTTLGVIENLTFNFGAGDLMFQVQVVETANFEVLLGRPFHSLTSCRSRDTLNGDLDITLTDPNTGKESMISTVNWLNRCPKCRQGLQCATHATFIGQGF
jgi:hypothetical protein